MGRLRDALAGDGLSAIAEIKRRSPSAGDLRPHAEPAALAASFERSGAAAISVLVDERFAGTVDDLRAARAATDLPLLAKGFFATEDELATLREAGADAVLLLLRDLDDDTAGRLQARAGELGMDALVEAHDAEELTRAVALGADPIGLNARDLATFEIDLVRSSSSSPTRHETGSWSPRAASPTVVTRPRRSWPALRQSWSAPR